MIQREKVFHFAHVRVRGPPNSSRRDGVRVATCGHESRKSRATVSPTPLQTSRMFSLENLSAAIAAVNA